jgi:hypothetical protein
MGHGIKRAIEDTRIFFNKRPPLKNIFYKLVSIAKNKIKNKIKNLKFSKLFVTIVAQKQW